MSSAPSAGKPGRYERSSNGLVGAMVILVLVILAFVGFRALFRGNQDDPVPTVAYRGAVTQARQDGALAPAPEPMPSGWRATSVRYQAGKRATWHLGLLTGGGGYVGIEEAHARATKLVDAYLGSGSTQGRARQLAGRTWQTWRDGSAYALTWTGGGRTVFVGGKAGEKAVVELVGVLGFGGTG
ncbi:DUF4245 domain-containing protein [Nocardioides mangrovicus]|uniref:DUF4245 domain-containing protein n=1 Tax=Nocardioides mangrovicus TaxID=2478913 RepID=UPI001314C29E|nr:DUF4245 domain-containing protein [Nocardioides mangrovicus]